MVVLKLYIAGGSTPSKEAVRALQRLCERPRARPTGRSESYQLQIIDVLNDPQQAANESILATPTLIKTCPTPSRRIIGDLTNLDHVLNSLEGEAPRPGHLSLSGSDAPPVH